MNAERDFSVFIFFFRFHTLFRLDIFVACQHCKQMAGLKANAKNGYFIFHFPIGFMRLVYRKLCQQASFVKVDKQNFMVKANFENVLK